MKFELDDILTDDILFYMENQDGEFLLDTHEGKVITVHEREEGNETDDDEDNTERFISLPEWSANDGYRLMEKFTVELKNPVVRAELSGALSKSKGVFRSFKNVLEQYPEVEKYWFRFKNKKMKNKIISWYNLLREEWGLELLGSEPEDIGLLVLEDFVIREGKVADSKKAAELHSICMDEIKERIGFSLFEDMKNFVFPVDLCYIAENANEELIGLICAVKDTSKSMRICALEVRPEYRGMGIGKTLLEKLLEHANNQQAVTIDLPEGTDFFSKVLHMENFKPCITKYIRSK
jgi:ribosomal protein S18 acetylase RimI-like enzyme